MSPKPLWIGPHCLEIFIIQYCINKITAYVCISSKLVGTMVQLFATKKSPQFLIPVQTGQPVPPPTHLLNFVRNQNWGGVPK